VFRTVRRRANPNRSGVIAALCATNTEVCSSVQDGDRSALRPRSDASENGAFTIAKVEWQGTRDCEPHYLGSLFEQPDWQVL